MKTPERFFPFDEDGILCMQDGALTRDPVEGEDRGWTEWHIEHVHGDVWEIERCDAENLSSFVYRGRIPSRHFFELLMENQEVPLPAGWTEWKG